MAKKRMATIHIVLEKKIRIKLRKWIKVEKRSLLRMIQNLRMERKVGKTEVEAEIATKNGQDRVRVQKNPNAIVAKKGQKKRT